MFKFLTAACVSAGLILSGATASASVLTVAAAPPGIQQSQQGPCIFGDPSGMCATLLSPNPPMGAETRTSTTYTVAEIVALVGATFGVGIDVNEASGASIQILEFFNMQVDAGMGFMTVAATNQSWELDDSVNNGNGVSDLIISLFDLSAFGPDALVRFNVGLSNLSDGREQFLFLDLDDISQIPLPAAIWLMGAGLAGLGFSARRKQQA